MAQKQTPQQKNIPLLHGMNKFLVHKSATVAESTLKKMNQLSDKIRQFEAYLNVKLYAENFDELIFNRFIDFLSKKNRLGDNTIASHVKTLRELLRFLNPRLSYDFIQFREEYPDLVYLKEEEIAVLQGATNLLPYLEKTRDLFLMMYYTGMKYSDLSFLNTPPGTLDSLNDYRALTSLKPYPPFVNELIPLLKKYGGTVPKITNQKLNVHLKELFRHLGLNRQVVLHKKRGGNLTREKFVLPEIITCQWARKTFLMTLVSNGIPVQELMQIAGISVNDTIKPYLERDKVIYIPGKG